MDIFNLGNIINSLRFNKKVEPAQQNQQSSMARAAESSQANPSEDSVSISEEARFKASIEGVSREIQNDASQVREDRVAEIREKIEKNEYQVSSQDIAKKIMGGTDIYDELK